MTNNLFSSSAVRKLRKLRELSRRPPDQINIVVRMQQSRFQPEPLPDRTGYRIEGIHHSALGVTLPRVRWLEPK